MLDNLLALLWKQIKEEAQTISDYHELLTCGVFGQIKDYNKPRKEGDPIPYIDPNVLKNKPELETLKAVVERIIQEERAHTDALKALYEQLVKGKPDPDMMEFTRKTLADYRERDKQIK